MEREGIVQKPEKQNAKVTANLLRKISASDWFESEVAMFPSDGFEASTAENQVDNCKGSSCKTNCKSQENHCAR